MPLNICTSTQSPRLSYILDVLLKELNGIAWKYVANANEVASGEAILHYSPQQVENEICIYSEGLIYESFLRKEKEHFRDGVLFPAPEDFSMPFDIFSASFYLLSRYEEYLPFQPDAHDRFPATESILYQAGLIQKALVNQWAIDLRNLLLSRFPALNFEPRRFEYISTLDIDQAWKYRHKGIVRNLGGWIRDLQERDWKLATERVRMLYGLENDPYDNFDWQSDLHSQFTHTRIQYFILLGDHAPFDKNCAYKNKAFRQLLRKLQKEKGPLGIHPSYQSNQEPWRVKEEIRRLQSITGNAPQISRQHFLMHRMPETYRTLIDAGITEEHTLGYSTHAGFRAGIAAPFYFFDLRKNEVTALRLFPFCLMDITHLHYEQLDVEQSIREQNALMDETERVGGLFSSLWHNESLSENGRWQGRRQVYEALFKEGSERMQKNAHK